MRRKRIVVLGATGSIGESAIKVARDIPERMEIVGLAANSNAEKLAAQANNVRPKAVCLVDETRIDHLRRALEYQPRDRSPAHALLAGVQDLRPLYLDRAITSTRGRDQ